MCNQRIWDTHFCAKWGVFYQTSEQKEAFRFRRGERNSSLLEHSKCSFYRLARAVIEPLEAIADGNLQLLHILLSHSCSNTSSVTTIVVYTAAAAAITAAICSLLLPLLTTDDVTLFGEPTSGAKTRHVVQRHGAARLKME